MDRYQKASYGLGNLIELVVKAMFGIVIVYLITKELLKLVIGDLGAQIISIILGLTILFAVVVSKRIRKEILSFGGKK
jgi:hypothetical protein